MNEATVSVIVPVKDGARYLPDVLDAIRRQRIDAAVETLVIDSGSLDASVEIATSFRARVIEIPAAEFGHGRTRNFAVEQATGDRIAFLTQDATPASEHWLAELAGALDPADGIGLAFGPHLARPDTSPMLARELEQFFGSFSPDGTVRVDDRVDPSDPASGFFSNVNSCVLRQCWEQVRFREVAYSEDQAFARDAIAAGWKKAYVPHSAVLHAHDYPFMEFMRRYFDEYRGLRATVGHVAPRAPAHIARTTRTEVRRDLDYMRRGGYGRGARLGWGLRSARHHLGRRVFAAIGSRSERLPDAVRERLSLEESAASADPAQPFSTRRVSGSRHPLDYIRQHDRTEPAPLAAPSPHDAERPALHLAWVIPPFRRGSGGHMTIFNIVRELEQVGHSCSIWVHDPTRAMGRSGSVPERELRDHFAELRAGVFSGFDDWHGADVALATGWQTAYPLAGLQDCKLKTYFVQDYEPDFYAASAHRLWAEATYRMDYPCLTASPWLTEVLGERFGAGAGHFDLAVDHHIYRPLPLRREPATIAFYARPATPRRGTELGLLALAEVAERRPDTRFVLFGDTKPPQAPFDYDFAGVVDEQSLAALYNTATVGLVLSLTNYSRIPKEMMACELPVVDIAHPSVLSVFGESGTLIETAEPRPLAIASSLIELLESQERRDRLAAEARRFVEPLTWQAAAAQIEGHLRRWLGERWSSSAEGGAQSRSASVDLARR